MKLFLLLGSIVMGLSVIIGAFGAHGLEPRLSERMMKNYQTGVQYQMIHGIGILVVGLVGLKMLPSALLSAAGWSFFVGILLFSGSLYAMALTGVTKLGAITPIGGLAFIAGWILLGIAVVR
ncbi:DUF423 domain-containing protein [Halalkalibacterium halodurans]|jgi:uncharacterized membrane protein YgdD (TMEM256/DUF423 family)|uniref:BH3828 protein n=2 Tax=Halalkalibacterium halodurans TaxID=86665 RepID=Q9K6A1_HALH5|nr:DUF423 domain-containing protein [Halalkalibacterium halodurans]MDY7224332.1 DUF423 domain-containing protein [Halalkalibacterium halodurans]MDY7243617.1 DUF423 domain-containing protein [Halalkalibacterium halodurans]MED3648001.1 DUF423 domain-containing protein [Halalkalibacterium halodurans]MED4079537.1 DUF423 domain-containing protein [Halalkalibacterium halodurans]MED4084186.1 DUF423 domain-containing protein [Halalkalibacterium halodurans]